MDDFSNHLSAKDASRNSKNAAWGGTFAEPNVCKKLKTVVFIAGKKNPATQIFFIHLFFIEN